MTGQRRADRRDRHQQALRVVGPGRQEAPIGADDRQPEQRPAPRARVVERQPDGERGLGGQPGRWIVAGREGFGQRGVPQERPESVRRACAWGQRHDPRPRAALVARDRRSVVREGRPGLLGRRDRCRAVVQRREVEGQLQAAPLPAQPAARPAGQDTAGHDGGRDRRAAVLLAEQLSGGQSRLTIDAGQPFDQGAELVLAEEPDDLGTVVVAEPRRRDVELDRQVPMDGHQLPVHHHLVVVVDDLETQLLGHDAVRFGVDRVEGAEVEEQLGRRLVTDARDARDVVGRVALERLEVDHLVRRQPVAVEDRRRVVDDRLLDPAARRHDRGPLADELEHVEVAGHDRRLEAIGLGLPRQGADEVVGLPALQLVDRDAERLDQLAHLGELIPEVVRHLPTRRLVLGEGLVTEGRPGKVEAGDDVVGPDVLEAAQDDAPEAEDGIDQLAVAGRQGGVVEREIGTIDEPVGIEQHQSFHAGECTRRRWSEPRQRRSGSLVARRASSRRMSRRAPTMTRPAPTGTTGSIGGLVVASATTLALVEVSV